MTYSQKNPIAFNEKPASSVKMNEEFVQIYGVLNEIDGVLNEIDGALNEIDGALNEIDGVKAPLESPALTGNPTAPTASKETDTTQLATTAFVKDVVADYAPLESPALTGSPTAPTQSADDDSTKIATTAHVLDRLQLYGIGVTTGVSVSNFDATDIPTGMYQVQNASGTNPGTAYGFLLVERYGTGGLKQTFTHIGTATTLTMAYRTYNSNTSTWTPWRQIFHQGNILGTVSQSDGIPTGAVIERGSNANGEYVKFADGTMICTGTGESTLAYDNASVLDKAVTFAAEYINTTYSPLMLTTAPAAWHRESTLFFGSLLTTGVNFGIIDNATTYSSGNTLLFRYTIIGRWF